MGIDYTKLDNVWVIGEPEDLGLLNKCAPYVLYKRNMFSDWAQFIEIFGQPVRIARYDVFDNNTKMALQETLDRAGSSLALLIPKSAEFEIMDGKTANANGELQNTFKEACNQELSIIVLGNTETTSGVNGSGSQAKAKTHLEQQQEISKTDIVYLTAMLNTPHFLKILASYGLPVIEGGYFEISRDLDIDFLSERKDIDLAIKAAGIPISDEYFYKTYSIPKPN
jgi:phage gp29-like protein